MPFDAIFMTALAGELRQALTGGKVDKLYQPARDEAVLHMRAGRDNVRLLLSASPAHPRAQLTRVPRENPETPPMFCMLLRKHFAGARLLELSQPSMERLLDFRFETLDELGDRVERRLVLECIGRKSNLIMLDGAGRITDCMRRAEVDLSAKRPVMPGLFYAPPEPTGRLDPAAMAPEELRSFVLANAPQGDGQDKWLLDTFNGLSPLTARELVFQGEGTREGLADRLAQLMERVKAGDFTPTVLLREGRPFDFTFQPILQYGPAVELKRYPTFSALLDDFYEQKEAQERVKQRGQDFIRSVTQARNRTAKKIANQEADLARTAGREKLRRYGDIITTNFYAMSRGQSVLRAQDYYDPACPEVDIPLDPLLTPQQNAARYYKDYKKAQKAEEMLTLQIEKNRGELDYLDSVLQMITLSEGDRDLQEIRQELMDNGYLKQHRRKMTAKGKQKIVHAKPLEFRSSGGLTILVGKNNSQNDRLTHREADKRDLWLHAQKLHGSHVILKTGGLPPDERSLTEAAMLAAWFSQGRDSGQVPVDYTPVKAVKKPAGAKPGYVIYHTYQTLYVTPDEETVRTLRGRKKN
ncbi:MAG: fibronectin/fibrinogen-binding protein [Oscillospiraceae bacterium]|jgi:predicted ribosome quality control (RQC) complex YloA/Tae2 family protein|nr:fibronectin/fibrinogen-binding protein [Oscillospiraceae bacterium]